ncbi:MAG: immunoglobulin domain-containing protein, partial [Prosthecobacter sp.]|nr:immunoglobulin domain-containing protein [Prosthecobacter sp.]
GKVIVGGAFTEFDGLSRTRLARLSSTGVLDTDFNVTVDGEVRAIVVQADNSIIIAGSFANVKGSGVGQSNTARNNIAMLNADGSLAGSYNPNANGDINILLLEPSGNLLVGGAFTNIGGSGRNRVARLLPSGSAEAFNPNANGTVYALARESDGSVLIGGAFTTITGSTRNRIARVNSSGVLQSFNPNANSDVRSLVVMGDGKIYVGGLFSTLLGTNGTATRVRNRLARLDVNGDVDNSFSLVVDAEVSDIKLLSSGKIALLGKFTRLAEKSMSYLGLLNADGSLDESFLPNPDYAVNALIEQGDGKLLVGGLFSNVGGATQHWVGRLNTDGTRDVAFSRRVNDRGQYTSMVSVGGIPAIAYYDVANGDLRYVRAKDVNGAGWEQSLVLDSAGNVGRGTSMKVANIGGDIIVKNLTNQTVTIPSSGGIATNGTPAIAYYDQTGGNLKYILSNTATGSDWSSPITIQSTDSMGNDIDVGSYLSMELVNGFPAVAYFNATTGDLLYTRATNVAGLTHNLRDGNGVVSSISLASLAYSSAWGTPQVLDSENIVGQFPSLAVVNGQPTTAAGTPAVAYYDVTNGDLKYVRANNADGMPSVDPLASAPWGSPVTVQSSGNVGRNTGLVMSDGVPVVSYQDVTAGNVKFIYLSDASGYSKLTFLDDTTWNGTINLDGMALFAPDAGQTAILEGALTGTGGFRLISEGTLLINSSDNVFGTALGANDQAPVIIRTGNLSLGSNTALGGSRVDLGDSSGNKLLPSDSPVITVSRATTSQSLTLSGGSFDSTHNGSAANVGGPGAFVGVSSTLDGVTYTSTDANTLILVKDEFANPERNGVYKVVFTGSQPVGTMNLVRASTMDQLVEFAFGVGVDVTAGASAGKRFYLVSRVTEVNSSAVIFSQSLIIEVELATTGNSVTRLGGYFDALHNGLFGNAGGPGAFVEVDTTIDGRVFSEADVGTLILVKDEQEHPEWNGVYRIAYRNGDQLDGTMNLVRSYRMDELGEFSYGTQVLVKNGTYANKAYFLASQVFDFNNSDVLWLEDVADGNLALRANVSGLTIANTIDVNYRLGAGSMSLGAADSVTSGLVEFTGAITLQNNQTTASETQNLNLESNITSGYGVRFTGSITEASASDVLTLTKTGSGVATLTGNTNTFQGGVYVNQGTLLVMNSDVVSGSATGSGLVTVNAGAVLGGVGRIGGSVQLTGVGSAVETRATLRVGDPTTAAQAEEKLTIGGALTVGPNSVVEFMIGTNNITKLAANSVSVTPTGRLLVSLADGYVPTLGTEFDIMDLATINSLTFTAGGTIVLSEYLKLPGAYVWDTSKFLTEGKIKVTGNTTPVAIVTSPSGATVNPGVGTTVNFTVTVSGSADFVYQWQKSVGGGDFVNIGSGVYSSSTSNTFTLTGVSESDEAAYQVLVTNGDGAFSATSAAATLIVNDPPAIVQQPVSTTLNPGQTATFTVAVSGPGPYSFQWRKGSTNITPDSRFVVTFPTAESCQLAISNVQESDDRADYNVIVSNLAGPAPTSSFVALNVNNPVVITNPPTSLQVSNQDPASFIVNATGTAPLTYQWQRDSGSGFEDVDGATSQRFTIPSVDLSESGQMVRVKITNVVGTVTSAAATITVVEGVPSILQQPESYTLLEGNSLSLTVRVGGAQAGRSVVWKRNKGVVKLGANTIKGVTSNISVTEELDGTVLVSTLTIDNISTGLAGEFSVDAKNVNVKKPVTSTPGTGQIVVVNNPNVDLAAEDGAKSAAMTVTAVGPKGVTINYLWKRNGAEIPAEETARILGLNTKTLTIKEVTTADTATYTCEVTGTGDAPDNMVVGGTYHLKVYTEAPVLGTGWDFPPAMVGEYFEFQVPLGGTAINTPDKYVASGLPAGLKLDAKTGWIRGYPTKVGDFPVVITISNKQGKVFTDPAPVLEVLAVPEGAVGVFAGWIPRDPDLNDDMGGRFDLTTTTKGTFSGKVTLGATAYAFKGILDLDATLTNPPTASVSVLRKGKNPVDLVFTINPAADRFASASVSATVQKTVDDLPVIEVVTLPFSGWRNKWSKLLPANGYIGYHTVALMPPDGLADDLPQGDSYMSITVAADGKLKMLGKTADGQTISGSQFVGPLGEIVVFQALYKTTPKGSLLGQLDLSIGDDSILEDNTITGSPTWNCPEYLSPKNRLYPNGFGPITLTATGGGYVDPSLLSTPTLILGLQDGTDNASLEFSLDGLSVLDGSPSLPTTGTSGNYLSIKTGNKIG